MEGKCSARPYQPAWQHDRALYPVFARSNTHTAGDISAFKSNGRAVIIQHLNRSISNEQSLFRCKQGPAFVELINKQGRFGKLNETTALPKVIDLGKESHYFGRKSIAFTTRQCQSKRAVIGNELAVSNCRSQWRDQPGAEIIRWAIFFRANNFKKTVNHYQLPWKLDGNLHIA